MEFYTTLSRSLHTIPGRENCGIGRDAGERPPLDAHHGRDAPLGFVNGGLEELLRLARLPRRRMPFT